MNKFNDIKYLLRKMLTLFLLCELCIFSSAAAAQSFSPGKALVIENVSLIDAISPSVQPNKTVLIIGNRIKVIGEKGKVSIPAKAIIINGKGKYLIPGLWDSHVHLESRKATLPLFIANGITSVREMGGDLQQLIEMRQAVASGQLLGPRIKTAGAIIESEAWLTRVLEATKKNGDLATHELLSKRIGISSPEHAKEVVKNLAYAGVDFIKIRNAGSPETFLTILAEAKKYGLSVAAHSPEMDLLEASAAGLKSLEHSDAASEVLKSQEMQKNVGNLRETGRGLRRL